MKSYNAEQMRCLAANLAMAVGVPQQDADFFSRSLVDADLQGTSTHGISRLSIYLQRLQKGLISPCAELKVDRNCGSIFAFDAGNGLGQVQAMRALEVMKPVARQHGVAAATIRKSQHFGALSYYCNHAADERLILLAMSNCEPAMSPAGGYEAFFGTNPIATSFPTGKGFHVKVDLATSIVARGNIIAAQKKGQPIPEGWALDVHGEPTTDAQEALVGTVLTMAGHKGYALALMIETFSSVLSGSAIGSEIGSMYKHLDRKQDVGHFFCLFDIRAFMEPSEFLNRMDETIDRLKAGKRRPGVEEILVPGERSARNYVRNLQQGIAISDETMAELERWCGDLNVNFICSEVNAQ